MKPFLARFGLLILIFVLPLTPLAHAQSQLHIGIFGLFHPSELELQPASAGVLSLSDGNHAFVLNGEPAHRRLLLHAVGDRILVWGISSAQWSASARNGAVARFQLSVPGKMKRVYEGILTVTAHHDELVAIVTMDREVAVASIVASEMSPHTPLDALKAQAVVTRSFLVSGSRHREFDFCDTTHCQFLRSPDGADSEVRTAVTATRGIVIAYHRQPLAAMYSSRCGGQTHSLREAGMNPGDGYPYYSVPCRWCREHPVLWQSRLRPGDEAPKAAHEGARIAFARQWGWSALPGSNFIVESDPEGRLLQGHSIGHGLGMCQFGAAGMATAGADFRAILAHYYPNSELIQLP